MKGPAEKFRYNKNGICAFHATFPTGAQRLFQTPSQDLQDVTELYLFLLLPQNSRHRLPFLQQGNSSSSIHALRSLTFSRTSVCSESSCCWGAAVLMARLAELLPFSRRVRAELLFDKLLESARISWRTILTTLLKSASVLPLENQRGVDVLHYLQLAAACHQPEPRSHVWFLLWHR